MQAAVLGGVAMSKRQIEVRTRDPYTHIPNAVIRDKNLRLQTRAVLILML